MTGKRTTLVVVIPLVIILLPVVYSTLGFGISSGSSPDDVFLEMPDKQYTECVRDTDYMRYHHWELLDEIRTAWVREGVRGEVGLFSCRECHPSRETFCNRCHEAVNLSPDCFGCHRYPASPDGGHTEGSER